MFDLHQHQHNTNIICGTYPIIAECEKEYNQMANLKNKLDEYFKSLKIKGKVNVEIVFEMHNHAVLSTNCKQGTYEIDLIK